MRGMFYLKKSILCIALKWVQQYSDGIISTCRLPQTGRCKIENSERVQRQIHDQQLSHPGYYISHAYTFKRDLCLCVFTSGHMRETFPNKGWDHYSAHVNTRHSVNSQPVISSFAHETKENKHTVWHESELPHWHSKVKLMKKNS